MAPIWSWFVPVNLSIKTVPDEVVRRLQARAESHHRSLQGELMTILEQAVQNSAALSPEEALAHIRGLALVTPNEAVDIVREMRDGH